MWIYAQIKLSILDKSIELTCEYIKRRGPKDFNYQLDLEIVNEKNLKYGKRKMQN